MLTANTNPQLLPKDKEVGRKSSYWRKLDESAMPRAILKSMLLPDEQLLQIGIVSAGIYWKSIAVSAAALLFMLLMFSLGLPVELMFLLGAALSLKVLIMFSIAY